MPPTPLLPLRARRGRAVRALALTVLLCAVAGPAAAASPTPSPSSGELRLPVVPNRVDASSEGCTKASTTVMRQVPWAQRLLGLGRAALFSDGTGVTVGVVDTGVSAKAAALSGRLSARPGADSDCVGHGTFVAGIIGAAPRTGVGLAGVAPGARIFSARGTDAAGTPSAPLVALGIRAAVDAGCEVVVVSAALPENTAGLAAAVRHATAHDVLLVAPAVPDDPDTAREAQASPASFWPAAAPGVLSAVDFGVDGTRPDGALRPAAADLAAPGDQVTGIGVAGSGHFVGSGPSLAAAYVAGTAALVRAYHPELTARQTAERMESTGYPADVPRLDVNGALTGVLPARTPDRPAPARGIRVLGASDDGGAVLRAGVLAGGCGALGLGLWAASALRRRAGAGARAGADGQDGGRVPPGHGVHG
ncbi:S8 family serine peptidase [Streptomyces sp. SAI-229]|uniref:S8 family serine peptidase n=1 Tax=Streptomyces sp. SAI-229 TaxID=3377731 RepID=UPI003C7E772E